MAIQSNGPVKLEKRIVNKFRRMKFIVLKAIILSDNKHFKLFKQ